MAVQRRAEGNLRLHRDVLRAHESRWPSVRAVADARAELEAEVARWAARAGAIGSWARGREEPRAQERIAGLADALEVAERAHLAAIEREQARAAIIAGMAGELATAGAELGRLGSALSDRIGSAEKSLLNLVTAARSNDSAVRAQRAVLERAGLHLGVDANTGAATEGGGAPVVAINGKAWRSADPSVVLADVVYRVLSARVGRHNDLRRWLSGWGPLARWQRACRAGSGVALADPPVSDRPEPVPVSSGVELRAGPRTSGQHGGIVSGPIEWHAVKGRSA